MRTTSRARSIKPTLRGPAKAALEARPGDRPKGRAEDQPQRRLRETTVAIPEQPIQSSEQERARQGPCDRGCGRPPQRRANARAPRKRDGLECSDHEARDDAANREGNEVSQVAWRPGHPGESDRGQDGEHERHRNGDRGVEPPDDRVPAFGAKRQCLRDRTDGTEEKEFSRATTRNESGQGESKRGGRSPADRDHAVRRRGSSASRSESPKRLKPNTAIEMAMPGAIASQGARSRNCMPAPRSMSPHEGVGSKTPRPRNERDASSRIAWPRNAVIMIR